MKLYLNSITNLSLYWERNESDCIWDVFKRLSMNLWKQHEIMNSSPTECNHPDPRAQMGMSTHTSLPRVCPWTCLKPTRPNGILKFYLCPK